MGLVASINTCQYRWGDEYTAIPKQAGIENLIINYDCENLRKSAIPGSRSILWDFKFNNLKIISSNNEQIEEIHEIIPTLNQLSSQNYYALLSTWIIRYSSSNYLQLFKSQWGTSVWNSHTVIFPGDIIIENHPFSTYFIENQSFRMSFPDNPNPIPSVFLKVNQLNCGVNGGLYNSFSYTPSTNVNIYINQKVYIGADYNFISFFDSKSLDGSGLTTESNIPKINLYFQNGNTYRHCGENNEIIWLRDNSGSLPGDLGFINTGNYDNNYVIKYNNRYQGILIERRQINVNNQSLLSTCLLQITDRTLLYDYDYDNSKWKQNSEDNPSKRIKLSGVLKTNNIPVFANGFLHHLAYGDITIPNNQNCPSCILLNTALYGLGYYTPTPKYIANLTFESNYLYFYKGCMNTCYITNMNIKSNQLDIEPSWAAGCVIININIKSGIKINNGQVIEGVPGTIITNDSRVSILWLKGVTIKIV